MIVRAEIAADHEEIRALVTVTMRAEEARLVDLVRASAGYVAGLALVAEEPGSLVGYVLLSHVTLRGATDRPVLALAPLCVRPDRQRRGIGGALVRAGLDRADARGEPLVCVLGHAAYYPRFGFEPARRRGVEPPSAAIPDEVFMVRLPPGRGDGLTGRIVYPPAFGTV